MAGDKSALLVPMVSRDLPGDAVYLEDAMYEDYILSLPEGDDLVSAPCGSKGTAFAGMYVAARVCVIVNSIGRGLPLPPKEVFHIGMNTSVAPEEVKQPATIN